MKIFTLISVKKYEGKYVALRSFSDKKVVASGKKLNDVIERAQKKGIQSPVLIFVPQKDHAHVV